MDLTDVLTALGEMAAQNFSLRRRVHELEQEVHALHEAAQREAKPPTTVRASNGRGEADVAVG